MKNAVNTVNHIIRVLNIKDIDDMAIDRIVEELMSVDITSYLSYIEKYHNHTDLSFMTGYQKFLELTKRYKVGLNERNARLEIEKGRGRASELANKVKGLKTAFNESEYKRQYLGYGHKELDFHNFKDRETGGSYFSKEDIALLQRVGNLRECLRLQEASNISDALEDKLSEILKAIAIRGASQTALEDKSANRDVMKLANTTARKF